MPTIVYGYFALTFITPVIQFFIPEIGVFNALSAGIAVGIMTIPMVSSLSEDAMSSVPRSLRDGAYALGATRLEVALRIVVPAALSGIVASAVLAFSRAISTAIEGIILVNAQNAYALSYLLKGSVAGVEWRDIRFLYPWIAAGVAVSLLLTGKLNLLRLGDEVAAGLGLRVRMIRLISSIAVVCLAGSAVAVSGPIAFIGLLVPHITRFLVGSDERWVVPCSGVLGALLLVAADLATRLVYDPEEVSVSILMSVIGAAFFIYLIRSRRIT